MFPCPRCLLSACALLVTAGCGVTESVHVGAIGFAPEGCRTALSSYALPRQVLNITVVRTGADTYVMQEIKPEAIADNANIFCFDHLANPLAHDTVRAFKTKIKTDGSGFEQTTDSEQSEPVRTPFLQLIASRSVDHTAGIIRNIVRTAFVGLSNNPAFTDARASLFQSDSNTVVAQFQIDPFDYQEMADANQGLRRYGFCLVLDDYTFNTHTLSPSRYCDAPGRRAAEHAPPSAHAIGNMRWHVPRPASGIFYRPRAPYRLAVYIKHRPDDRGAWTLGLLKNINMENIMPVVSVGIDRAVFATRRTGLIFEDGSLQNVCISKGSELAGFIDIPLDVVYGVIALPSETLRATFDNLDTRKQLIEAQERLFKAQEQYIEFLQRQGEPAEIEAEYKTSETLSLSKKLENEPTPGTAPSAEADNAPPDAGEIKASAALERICKQLLAAGKIADEMGQLKENF